jgi:hypothetical protein
MSPAPLVMGYKWRTEREKNPRNKIWNLKAHACTKFSPCRLLTQRALFIFMSPSSFRYLRLPYFPSSPSPSLSPILSPPQPPLIPLTISVSHSLTISSSPHLPHHLRLPFSHHLSLPSSPSPSPSRICSPSPSTSPSLYLLHLHLPPNYKVRSAQQSSMRIACWHGNHLIIYLYLAETEIRWRKDETKLR